jgi:peptide/nickel transport system ATP-binding protein
MAQTGNLLAVRDLRVGFVTPGGAVQALKGVSFRVRAGSSVAIVGESGSGKSVTAQAIMGLLPKIGRVESGEILFTDPKTHTTTNLARLSQRSEAFRTIRGARISMIFQEPMTSLSPLHRTGFQIQEALELHTDTRGAAAKARVIEMLRLVRFPDPERGYRSYPFELSGGLRQRAMIAMALICRPALLVADEPTTALDVTVQAQVLGLMRDLQRELGMAVLLITHDMGVVANMADEVVVMYRGEVMEAGTASDIFRNPSHPYLKALMSAVPRIDPDSSARLVPMFDTSDANAARPRPLAPAGAGPLVEVKELSKQFQLRSDTLGVKNADAETATAVDRVSLTIRRGECVGLVGESGCGKTTFSKMIMGAVEADSGQILFHRKDGGAAVDLAPLSEHQRKADRRHIQYLFQDPFGALNPRMTVLDLISEPMVVQGIGSATSRRAKVKELLERVRLDKRFLNRYPHSFSGGQRQRLGIARALSLEPELLILDEPVSALDVSTQAQVLNLLNDLRADHGLTYLFITHNLAVVNYVADRIAVMCRGRIVELAPRADLFRRPRHPYTRALLASAPVPDLDHPLDFAAIRDGQATDPANWAAPFDDKPGDPTSLVEVAPGHLVRARATEPLATAEAA